MADTMSGNREAAARLEDIFEEFKSLPPQGREEYLLRLYQGTLQEQIRATKGHDKRIDDLDKEVGGLSGILRNHVQATGETLGRIEGKIEGINSHVDSSFASIMSELATIRKAQKEEAEAREKQDSIHETEITGVKERVELTEKKVGWVASSLAVVKETVTTRNVAKGTFLAVVVSIIEAVIKNWDKIPFDKVLP